jgi:putative FmdB family regulatory protein
LLVPIYDFRCRACGSEFELTSSIAEREAKAVCPHCGSHAVRTVFRPFSIGGAHKSSAERSGALRAAAKP